MKYSSYESHGNFKFVTVQDVTYIINETKVGERQLWVAYPLLRKGTIRLKSIDPGAIYTVLITPDGGDEIKGEYPDFYRYYP